MNIQNSNNDLFQRALNILREQVSDTVVNTWFRDAEPLSFENDVLAIYTPSEFNKGVILDRFIGPLESCFKVLLGHRRNISIRIICGEEELREFRRDEQSDDIFLKNSEFTFERFIVGNSNKFAHAAATAVAQAPASAYNPLLIYGVSGLGKTHLLYAIGHHIRATHPDFRIVYVKGDDFTNELVHSIQINKASEFREKYRRADLLLVDDIQFIAGKDRTQEEFFHTFNTLYESRRQIVMTSDRPPKEMALLEDRLRTRFEWGIIADIQPPEYETRLAIIKDKADSYGLQLPDEVVDYIAFNVTSNVRQIEGTVKKLLALRELMNSNMDIDAVTRAVQDILKDSPGIRPKPNFIISQVSKYFSVDERDIRGQRRDRNIVLARQVSMYLIRKLTDLSLPEIGREFQGRDHTTVLHSISKIDMAIEKDTELLNSINAIQEAIASS